jgi:ribonucleoside-diphosphate reductase alpha chain
MSNTFPSDFEEFIYTSRYARWIESEGRREQWHETVARYVGFMRSHATEFGKDNSFEWDKIERAIINFDVMPSMRALMTAGPALARDNTAG